MEEFNFLRNYVSLFENTEVPSRFSTWCGISCISAALERRVWIDFGLFVVYPNTYIILAAEAARCRKSTAVKMTERLLQKMDPGPKLIAQKITPEAMIEALKGVLSEDKKTLIKETCGGMVICDELVVFLNKQSYDAGLSQLLLPFWDCPDKFEYRTRGHGSEEIFNGHLSLLGASTIHNLREAIPIKAMGDGLTSRIIFVHSDEVSNPVPRPTFSDGKRATVEALIRRLQQISQLTGPIKLTDEANEFFDAEYMSYYKRVDMWADDALGAYSGRRHIHLLKVAICLMAAAHPELCSITVDDLQGAKVLLETYVEKDLNKVYNLIASTEDSSVTEKVFRTIKGQVGGVITKVDLLRAYSHRLSVDELEKVVKTLTESKRVKFTTLQGSGLSCYQVIKD